MASAPFSPLRESFYRSMVENTRSRSSSSARIHYAPSRSRWAERTEHSSELRNSRWAGQRAPSRSLGPHAGRCAHSEGPSNRRGALGRKGRDSTRRMDRHSDGQGGSHDKSLSPPAKTPETSTALALIPTILGADHPPPQIFKAAVHPKGLTASYNIKTL
uniref:Uncharacterized protein n=1 Tax=Sphaerodactylus townsendi TaxID=933632 RepID=A0ACB8G0J1_9SAUR